MSIDLQRLSATAATAEVAAVLQRDGAVIVTDALSSMQLQRLNTELDDVVEHTAPGLRHPTNRRMVEFYGERTIRLDGLPAKSDTFVELIAGSFMTQLADHLLLPNCDDYLVNTGQLIQIGPGEHAQALHRDEDAWSYYQQPKPLLQVEAMFALSDFTVDNGTTQVVPGSHLWPPEREARPHEITRAIMPAGSALIYLGKHYTAVGLILRRAIGVEACF